MTHRIQHLRRLDQTEAANFCESIGDIREVVRHTEASNTSAWMFFKERLTALFMIH